MTNTTTTTDHKRDRTNPPRNLLDRGSAAQRPYALIARDRLGYESVFVKELLPNRIVLRAGPKGYSMFLLEEGRVYCPSNGRVCCRSIPWAGAALNAAEAASAEIESPLTPEELEAVAEALQGLPQNGPAAHSALRVTMGSEPKVAEWMHPRWDVRLRSALRGY